MLSSVTCPTHVLQRGTDIRTVEEHERVSVMLGSKNEVERLTRYHAGKPAKL